MFRKRASVALDFSDDPGLTKQSHKDECDINNILAQFKRTGIVRHINERQGLYVDLPSDIDLQQSLAIVRKAEKAFSELPSKVRDRFNNDPGKLLAAIQNPDMHEELRGLGLLKPARPPDPEPGGSTQAGSVPGASEPGKP